MLVERVAVGGLKGPRTELELGRLTLIEGPNGVGKSRVIDAVCFALGLETAGVSPDGRNLAAALEGSTMFSEISIVAEAERRIVRRERRLARGTFKRSVLSLDGEEVEGLDFLGAFNPRGGRALVDLSEAALLNAVAEIGARDASGGLIAALEAAASAFSGGWKPSGGAPLDRLQALTAAIAEWAKAAKREAKDAAASADRSRRALGAARVSIGLAAKKAEEASAAQARASAAAEALGRLRAEKAAAEGRITEIAEELERSGSSGGRRAELEAELPKLHEAAASAEGALRAAAEEEARARRAFEALEAEIQGIEDRAAGILDQVARRKEIAAHLEAAPCSAAADWISLEEQEVDPFVQPADLCGACPFISSARGAAEGLEELERQAEALEAEAAGKAEAWKAAGGEASAKKAAREAAEAALGSARAEARRSERELSEARRDSGIDGDQRAALERQKAELEAKASQAAADLRKQGAELEAARAAQAEAEREASEARVLEERLRRLKEDEAALETAEARLEAAAELEKQAGRVKGSLAEAGERKLLELASPFVVGPWSLAFDEGRVGLRDEAGAFWTGVGLSAAQREILFSALDLGMSALNGEALRIAMIEADPIDGPSRAALLERLEGAVERGELTQAFVCSWLPLEAGPAWKRIQLDRREPGEPAATPGEPEADPFAAPSYVEAIEAAEGPALTDWLKRIKAGRPGAYQKIPRRLEDRRELLLELVEELEEAERQEVIGC